MLTPSEWSVGVVGRWNRAILTPSGIARRLFKLDEGIPVEVLVPLDVVAPYQVKHQGLVVLAASDRLIVHPEEKTYHGLKSAMEVGHVAVDALPETPLAAVGININYACEESLHALRDITFHVPWDDRLSDAGYEVHARELSRSIVWREGTINFSVSEVDGSRYDLRFNFDRKSTSVEEHKAWLQTSTDDMEKEVSKILLDCVGLTKEEITDA